MPGGKLEKKYFTNEERHEAERTNDRRRMRELKENDPKGYELYLEHQRELQRIRNQKKEQNLEVVVHPLQKYFPESDRIFALEEFNHRYHHNKELCKQILERDKTQRYQRSLVSHPKRHTPKAIRESLGNQIRTKEKRKLIVAVYGGCCVCCSEDHFTMLDVDHKEGGGAKHRAQIPGGPNGYYNWIIDNNYPDYLQVLCCNCNQSKQRNGGICEHQIGDAIDQGIIADIILNDIKRNPKYYDNTI